MTDKQINPTEVEAQLYAQFTPDQVKEIVRAMRIGNPKSKAGPTEQDKRIDAAVGSLDLDGLTGR